MATTGRKASDVLPREAAATAVLAEEIDDYNHSMPRMSSEMRRAGSEVGATSVEIRDHGRLLFGSIRVGFSAIGHIDTDPGILTIAAARASAPGAKWDGHDIDRGDAFLYPGGGHHQAVDVPGVDAVFAVLEEGMLEEAIDALGRHRRPLTQGKLNGPHASLFLRTFRRGSPAADATEVLEAAARIASSEPSLSIASRGSSSSSGRIVRSAIDYASDTGDWMPSSMALCRAAGVSERRLQTAFHDVYDCPPSQFFRMRALSEARSRLLAETPHASPVSTVAVDVGFRHLGRFSSLFKEQFGEYPSDVVQAWPDQTDESPHRAT